MRAELAQRKAELREVNAEIAEVDVLGEDLDVEGAGEAEEEDQELNPIHVLCGSVRERRRERGIAEVELMFVDVMTAHFNVRCDGGDGSSCRTTSRNTEGTQNPGDDCAA